HGDEAAKVQNQVLETVREYRQKSRLLAPKSPPLEPEQLMDDYYEDPLAARSEEYAGRWLAGFAPVGATEFVVIVQQRYNDAVLPVNTLASTLAWRGWI